MNPPVRPDRVLRFGEFELDQDAGELRRNGTRVSLPEQPFRLLTVLLERPGTIATRDELRERLWGTDTFVDFEHGVNAAVKRLGERNRSISLVARSRRRPYRQSWGGRRKASWQRRHWGCSHGSRCRNPPRGCC